MKAEIFARISYVSDVADSTNATMIGGETYVGRGECRSVTFFLPAAVGNGKKARSLLLVGSLVLVRTERLQVRTEKNERGTFAKFVVNDPTSFFILPQGDGDAINLIPDSKPAKLPVTTDPYALKLGVFNGARPLYVEAQIEGRLTGLPRQTQPKDEGAKPESYVICSVEQDRGPAVSVSIFREEGQKLPFNRRVSVSGPVNLNRYGMSVRADVLIER